MRNNCDKNDRFLPQKFGGINKSITFVSAKQKGQLPKRPTGADCNSADLRLRRFESFTAHFLRCKLYIAEVAQLIEH